MIKKHPKNAFTLIELLAVILILGIIALIAIPTVNKVITEVRLNASVNSGRNYIKAVNSKLTNMELDDNILMNGKYIITDGNLYLNGDKVEVKVKGSLPNNDGEIYIKNNKITKACITVDGKELAFNGKDVIAKNCKYAFNLITNGYLDEKSNNNFKTFSYQNGYLKNEKAGGEYFSDEFIKVDPSKIYNYSLTAKSNVTDSRTYLGLAEYDIDKNNIRAYNVTYTENTLTKLTQTLNDGDTVVHLENINNFLLSDITYINGLIFWNYKDSTGYKYQPETHSRNVFLDVFTKENVDKVNNTITLKKPWSGGTIESGTELSQSNSGNIYNYGLFIGNLPNTDTTYNLTITGTNNSYLLKSNMFRHGTKYIKFLLLHNYGSNDENKITYLKDIVFKEVD